MCCLTEPVKITTDIDSLRSEIRDKSVRVIDVRREGDYKQDHIPNSVNLPLATLLSDDSPERVLKLVNSMGIDDETPVVERLPHVFQPSPRLITVLTPFSLR